MQNLSTIQEQPDEKNIVEEETPEEQEAGQEQKAEKEIKNKTVFVHEKTGKEKILDKGLAQLQVGKKNSAAPGIDKTEQQAAKRTFFKVGVDKALSLYDIDNPKELVDYFLEVEIKNNIKNKKITDSNLEIIVEAQTKKLTEKFGKGAEELFKKYKLRNYSVTGKVREILKEIKINNEK